MRKQDIRLQTTEQFKTKLKLIQPNLEVIGEYIRSDKKILVKTKYGVCNVTAHQLILGCPPTVQTAINKTEYFINYSKDKLNSNYDYSLVDYKDVRTKIKLICPEHGIFEQTPAQHIRGVQCPKCATINKEICTWRHTSWEKCGLKSKHFTGFKVYILECWNEEERFFKIGKTYKNISKRFNHKKALPYEWKIVKMYEGSSKYISELENILHRKNKKHKYIPLINFKGSYECFSKVEYSQE